MDIGTFHLIKTEGQARRGEFCTAHGVVQTPVFQNVGTAGAIVFGDGLDASALIGIATVFAGIGGLVGQLMWNFSYALNLPLNRVAQRYAEAGDTKHMWVPNVLMGQAIGFLCRFVPAMIVLWASCSPSWSSRTGTSSSSWPASCW